MLKSLRKLCLILTCFLAIHVSSQAQNDAIVVGHIDSAVSRIVRVEFKRNHFSLEPGSFEAILDANNVFSFRVKLTESRAVYCTYKEQAMKIFLVPGDTLKMNFTSNRMLETMVFDGNAAGPNDFLLGSQRKFPDWHNESLLERIRLHPDKTSHDYALAIDSIYVNRKGFFDAYPTDLKSSFSNDFLDYAINDVSYWRAYQFMLYIKKFGLKNSDPIKQIDDSYFNFMYETDNAYYKALNNEYYLQYLELYLDYIRERDGYGKQTDGDIIEEHSRSTQIVRSKARTLRVMEDPYLGTTVTPTDWLSLQDEGVYMYLSTTEKFRYSSEDSTFEDIFLKIRTGKGKTGWVPQSLVTLTEKTITEKTVRRRSCIDSKKEFCGFEDVLNGKVLYFTMTKDILYSFMYDNPEVMQLRMKNFIDKNTDYREYNQVLRNALKLTMEDLSHGLHRLNIPVSCDIERYDRDRDFYAIDLKRLVYHKETSDIVETNVKSTPPVVIVAPTPKPTPPVVIVEPTPTPAPAVVIVEPTPKPTPPVVIVEPTPTPAPAVVIVEPTPKPTPPVVIVEPTPTPAPAVVIVEPTPTPVPAVVIVEPTPTPAPAVVIVEPTPKPIENREILIPPTTPGLPVWDNSGVTISNNGTVIEKPTQGPPTIRTEPPVIREESSSKPVATFVSNPPKTSNKELDPTQGVVAIKDLEYNASGSGKVFSGLVINTPMPQFTITDVNGKPVLPDDLVNKVLFIDFWATYCGPCMTQMGRHKELAEKYKSNPDVVFLFISTDTDITAWKDNMQTLNIKNTGIQANDHLIIPINFMLTGLPNYFVVGKNGNIALNSRFKSPVNAEQMIDILVRQK